MNKLLLLALCGASSLFAQKPIAVQATLEDAEAAEPSPPLKPLAVDILLTDTAPKGFHPPKDCAAIQFAVYAFAKKDVVFAVGRTERDSELPDVLFIDLDRDGSFGDAERFPMSVQTKSRRADSAGVSSSPPIEVAVPVGAAKVRTLANYLKNGERGPWLQLRFPSYLRAAVKVGDEACTLGIVDRDLDGQFDGPDDLWVLAGPKAPKRLPPAETLTTLSEHRLQGGHLVAIKVMRPNVIEVNITTGNCIAPAEVTAHRMRVEQHWAKRWQEVRDAFYADYEALGLAVTDRQAAQVPVQWHYVSFAEGLALAKKANKPMFVELISFAEPGLWFDAHATYSDQEVTSLLNDAFVPVRIVREHDFVGEYDGLLDKLKTAGTKDQPVTDPNRGAFATDGRLLVAFNAMPPVVLFADFVEQLQVACGRTKK